MQKFINYLEVYYLYIITSFFIIIIALSGSLFYYINQPVVKEVIKEIKVPLKKESKAAIFFVDLKGAVKKPGVYQVTNERVNDLIQRAGGLLKNADTSNINLSQKLTDEMVIIINTKQELKKIINPIINQPLKNDALITNNSENTLINLNTADLNTLMTLTGIGEAKAKDIINYREQTPFTIIEDLKNVKGIGDSTFDKIKNLITI